MIEPSSQEQPISKFVQAIKSGVPIPDAIKMWGQKSAEEREKEEHRRKAEELKKSLFAEKREERQSSSSLCTSDVLEAIEALKLSASKKFCRQRVRLNSLQDIYDTGTMLMPSVETGYHVVIEKNRPFSLKMTDPDNSTLALMEIACLGCLETKKHWPTCILVKMERFYKLECNLRWYTIEGRRIPFDCAPDDGDYDIMVIYDEIAEVDEWMQDRKSA